jgi:hypothetical protein
VRIRVLLHSVGFYGICTTFDHHTIANIIVDTLSFNISYGVPLCSHIGLNSLNKSPVPIPTHAIARAHKHTRARTHTCAYTQTHIHTYTRKHTHSHGRTYTHTHAPPTRMITYMWLHEYIREYSQCNENQHIQSASLTIVNLQLK